VGSVVSLLPFARRVAADAAKAREKAAGASPPAPGQALGPEPASPTVGQSAAIPANDDLETAVAEAQATLARACDDISVRRDPVRLILEGLSDTIGVLPNTARRMDAAVGAVIAARHPMTPEERADLVQALVGATQEGAFQGTRKEAARMIRRLDHGLAVRMGLYVGAAFVAGCVLTVGALAYFGGGPFNPDAQAGAAWREMVRLNPDPRPLLDAGEVRTDRTGRRYHAGVSLWMDPSPSPPGAPARPKGGQ
jgi:hypothetical protein